MPIHDWSQFEDSLYHSFEHGWVVDVSRALNQDVLPKSHFAMIETLDLRPQVGFYQMKEPDCPVKKVRDGVFGREATVDPPTCTYSLSDSRKQYACRAISIRHGGHFQPVAAILFATRQDKQIPYRFDALVQLAVGAITHGLHLLVIDPLSTPEGAQRGIHTAIWNRLTGEELKAQKQSSVTISAFDAFESPSIYVDALEAGDSLPNAPLFLKPGLYVEVPLESTYQAAWASEPARIRNVVESAGISKCIVRAPGQAANGSPN